MILIADSGSTKTAWALLREGNVELQYTQGLNPYYIDEAMIAAILRMEFKAPTETITHCYFYGAGCTNDKKGMLVSNAIKEVLSVPTVEVYGDMFGACRALFGDKHGVAGILGTGSNSCEYDGQEVIKNVPALGYIIGDEGSGAYLGKKLLQAHLREELPREVSEKLLKEHDIELYDVIDQVYKNSYPNRYLASFAPFLKRYEGEKFIREIIESALEDFYQAHLSKYDLSKKPVSFVGSIAFHFQEHLQGLAKKHKFNIGQVLKNPIDGLVEYHLE